MMRFSSITQAILFTLVAAPAVAQPSFAGLERFFVTPRNYVACYTNNPPTIDGKIKDDEWQNARWSEYFRDIEGDLKPEPLQRTRMKMLWNEDYLFVAAKLEETNVWGYLEKFDEVIYQDNDFEVFIDPDNDCHHYYELEFNARNTVFDLFLPKPYRDGNGVVISWNMAGLKSAVVVQGTLNYAGDTDKSWTIEMAIPIATMTGTPKAGEFWRVNFSRVEWQTDVVDGKYVKRKNPDTGRNLPEYNWVWSPQGAIDMHRPERWGYLLFTDKTTPAEAPAFTLPYEEKQRQYLWLVYYRQHAFRDRNRSHFASSLSELGVTPTTFNIDGQENFLSMEATSRQFTAVITVKGSGRRIVINDKGRVWSE